MSKFIPLINGVEWICLDEHGDERGTLVAIEEGNGIPFQMNRIYYIYNAHPDVVRGKHAHRDLHQVLLCLNGSCDILVDNGTERKVLHLDNPSKGIYIHSFVWREMSNFASGTVLLAVVDKKYDIKDYVFDYKTVLNNKNGGTMKDDSVC